MQNVTLVLHRLLCSRTVGVHTGWKCGSCEIATKLCAETGTNLSVCELSSATLRPRTGGFVTAALLEQKKTPVHVSLSFAEEPCLVRTQRPQLFSPPPRCLHTASAVTILTISVRLRVLTPASWTYSGFVTLC